MDIRERLKKHRERFGLTINAQATLLGLSHANTIYNIEHGTSVRPYKGEELHLRLDRHEAEVREARGVKGRGKRVPKRAKAKRKRGAA